MPWCCSRSPRRPSAPAAAGTPTLGPGGHRAILERDGLIVLADSLEDAAAAAERSTPEPTLATARELLDTVDGAARVALGSAGSSCVRGLAVSGLREPGAGELTIAVSGTADAARQGGDRLRRPRHRGRPVTVGYRQAKATPSFSTPLSLVGGELLISDLYRCP